MRRQILIGIECLVFVSFVFASSLMADLREGLLGHWELDETSGTTARDASGNGHDATLTGKGLTWMPEGGKIKGALSFDGGGDVVVDEKGADYINGLSVFTVALWVKSNETTTDRGFISAKDPNGESVFALRYDAAGVRGGGVELIKMDLPTSGGDQEIESSNNVQTTDWQHIALTWESGKGFEMYIDGVLDEPVFTYDPVEGVTTEATKLIIGKAGKDKGRSWNGMIDDVRIYSRALERQEIEALASGRLSVGVDGKLAVTWASIKSY